MTAPGPAPRLTARRLTARRLAARRRSQGRRRRATSPLAWLGGLLALYLLLPLGGLVAELVSGHGRGFAAPGLSSALVVSLATATCTTVICAELGVPLAYALARSKGTVATLVGVVVLLPLALPPLMAGIALVSVVGPDTALGQFFGGRLTDSMAGIVLAQTFVAAPFTIVAARSAFATVDPALDDVAATLGLRKGRRFVQVALPVAARGIAAGLLLTWLRAFGEFGATVVVAYHPYSLPVYTYVRFGGFGLDQAVVPSAVALAAAVAVLLLTRLRFPRRPARSTAVSVPPSPPPTRGVPGAIAFAVDEHFGNFRLSLTHQGRGGRLAILGPSGAGKTTVLRCLAGLGGSGELRLGSKVLGDLAAEERRIGYVPQEPNLLPHRAVSDQVELGVDVEAGVAAFWVAQLGLHGLERRRPTELSGGQRQRVSLARALARAPDLLLLDEPFAALDVPVRSALVRELRQVLQAGYFASVLVTHDPEEAALLADEIVVIEDGRLLQAGATSDVLGRPASPRVARLLGVANVSSGRVTSLDRIESNGATLRVAGSPLPAAGTEVFWSIRPEHVAVSFEADGAMPYAAVVLDAVDLGSAVEVRLMVAGAFELLARLPPQAMPALGAPCSITIPADRLSAWPAQGAPAALSATGP